MNQKGQVVLVLILIMTVALSIGLSIVQRSLIDVSTASRVEQSSRAFSAAEAGIEKILQTGSTDPFNLQNESRITSITDSELLPQTADVGSQQSPLEIGSLASPLAKEEIAQVWLADPNSTLPPCLDPAVCYRGTMVDIYWGNSTDDKAALVLTLIYWDGSAFASRKWYLDHSSASRSPSNGFDTVLCSGGYTLTGYQCYKRLGDSSGINNGPLPAGLMLLRARLLYNKTSQPFAVQAVGTCGSNCSLPPQQRVYTATGTSGSTQRRIQLIQQIKILPPFFDYALFSAGDINK